ncbi:hypothetical protein H5410_044354 [Solanum commersonii]|uniref:Dolichyl-diphosphooligosaccharide--protein glycosyltransferase subunit 4 n=1 Tax=Solanum commersonii TaxID=4109 RepID=A0A9J5XAM2_SOLCO|nr:hypothetical protein H5410_044354 [Solanum commersonii]
MCSLAPALHVSWFLGTLWPVDSVVLVFLFMPISLVTLAFVRMIDDQDLGFFANFLGIFIFVLVVAYHYVMADPKYEGN